MTTYQSGDKAIVSPRFSMYRGLVAANSASGCGSPINNRRTSVHVPKTDAFFVPEISSYGGCAWGAFERAGFLLSRSSTPAHSRHPIRVEANRGGSSTIGATPMNIFALSPSDIQHKIERHRARAIAQLNTKSSLKVRTERYNAEMARARFYEAMLKGAK